MNPFFVSAEWRKILFINYLVPHEILKPYLPPKTALDLYNGECLISLAGFQFLNLCFSRLPIPYHKCFEEFNLRFYVVFKENNIWKRGVMFISEIVPKPFFKFLANTLMREKYVCYPMKHKLINSKDQMNASYSFKVINKWNSISSVSGLTHTIIQPGTLDEFIAEHYWGYNKWNNRWTLEYKLDHPRWSVYDLHSFHVDIRFEDLYPKQFLPYLYAKPHSAQLVDGSAVKLRPTKLFS
jgi:uncharacterized protein